MSEAAHRISGASLRQYTTGKHDLSALSLPGRVLFIKSRRHKQVAHTPVIPTFVTIHCSLGGLDTKSAAGQLAGGCLVGASRDRYFEEDG